MLKNANTSTKAGAWASSQTVASHCHTTALNGDYLLNSENSRIINKVKLKNKNYNFTP